MSKTSIKITINNKEYSYDFAKFGFYALCTAEKEYGLNPLELENNPMSTILSLFAFVAGMDVDKAGAEIDAHLANGGSIEDLCPLLTGFQECSFFQSMGKSKK